MGRNWQTSGLLVLLIDFKWQEGRVRRGEASQRIEEHTKGKGKGGDGMNQTEHDDPDSLMTQPSEIG